MTPEDYVKLPYHIVLQHDRDEDGNEGWVAEVQELEGCISQGDTPDEAIERVRDAMLGWISVLLDDGQNVPLPAEEPTHSGKVLLRLPRGLHAVAAREAEAEGVSLNKFIVAALAGAVRWRAPSPWVESTRIGFPPRQEMIERAMLAQESERERLTPEDLMGAIQRAIDAAAARHVRVLLSFKHTGPPGHKRVSPEEADAFRKMLAEGEWTLELGEASERVAG